MCPEVGLSEEQLKITLERWTKKDDYRELYTAFDHCGLGGIIGFLIGIALTYIIKILAVKTC
jgi:hypothetical protein